MSKAQSVGKRGEEGCRVLGPPLMMVAGASYRGDGTTYGCGVRDVSLVVEGWEFVLIKVDADECPIPLFDLMQGLVDPDVGVVKYLGDSWDIMHPTEKARRRTTMGRTFASEGAWVSNLSLYDGCALSAIYHGLLDPDELRTRMADLARDAGMKAVPLLRPHEVGHRDLLRSQWVRAFLLNPKLVLLEQPTSAQIEDDLPLLSRMVDRCIGWGGSVVWLTFSDNVWNSQRLREGRRMKISGGRLVEGK